MLGIHPERGGVREATLGRSVLLALLVLDLLVACHLAPSPAQAVLCTDATDLIVVLTASTYPSLDAEARVLLNIQARLDQDARLLRSDGDQTTATIAQDLANAVGMMAANLDRPTSPQWPQIKDLVNRLPSCSVEVP